MRNIGYIDNCGAPKSALTFFGGFQGQRQSGLPDGKFSNQKSKFG
jgi:hypothetical protein